MKTITFDTPKKGIVDITDLVEGNVDISGGLVLLFAPHATGALTITENEPGLIRDLERKIEDLVPKGDDYLHDRIDDNAHAHITSALIGCHLVIPVEHGKLALGTWQRILFIERDGPRRRRIHIVEIPTQDS